MFDRAPATRPESPSFWIDPGERRVPSRHGSDPFACPCCANVFAELLGKTSVDLARQGRTLPGVRRARSRPTVLTNAKILTMNAAAPEADSLVVVDGRIEWVGAVADLPDSLPSGACHLDLEGRVVLPGFVEPHMHLIPLAMLQALEDVGPFRFERVTDAVEHLRAVAETTPVGDWVVGRQFDPSLQEGPDALTREMLDDASARHPIFVYNASLHIAYCNSRALEIAGLEAGAKDPPGSEFGRDAGGQLNGVLKGGPAMAAVARYNPTLHSGNIAQACLDVLAAANRVGITTLCDQGTGMFQGLRELGLYDGMRASGRMTARFRFSVSQALASKIDEADVAWGHGDEWVRATGWKIVSDGSNQGRTGLQREPFLRSDEKGIAYVDKAELESAVELRLRDGWAICIHANGDAAIDRALDAYERAHDLGLEPGARRCRIEHCSILHDEQIDRMAALGISPSFLIGHVHYWGRAFIDDIFGLEKASKLDRTGACEERGIRWTIHSDDPVTPMNPLRCMENAVTRSMWKSDQLLSPEECVPVEAALRAATIDAAWQCHSDHEVGSLEVGKFADFVVLDRDPRELEGCALGGLVIQETWVDGERVYEAAR